MTELEMMQQSVERSAKMMVCVQAKLQTYQKSYGIPDCVFDELKRCVNDLQFWASNLHFWEGQVIEVIKQEAVYPPPGE